MSFIDLLFPAAELEALGNKWHEPAPKRRRLESGAVEVQHKATAAPRRQNSEPFLDQRRHRLSTSSHQSGKLSSSSSGLVPVSTTKRSLSDSQPRADAARKPATASATTVRSCLPSFIEPSILKNYLHHLHPNDRSRYSLPNSPKSETHTPPQESRQSMGPKQEAEEAVSSPGSLINDSAASPSSDNCPTPSSSIVEQFRSGPFGHIFDGMRITDHERDMMEDLLSPFQPGVDVSFAANTSSSSNKKRKEATPEVEIASEDYYEIDEALLQKMFPQAGEDMKREFNFEYPGITTNANRETDVHSSGLSPASQDDDQEGEEEEEDKHTSPAGIVVYDYSALSVDDFFDLEEASTSA